MIEKKYSFERAGKTAEVYSLTNSMGMEMVVSTLGGRIISLTAPDRNGHMGDVIVGYSTAEEYADREHIYHGAFIGRYGNRIGGAAFSLGGKEYKLSANDGRNTLHGGAEGFDVRVMQAKIEGGALVLSYRSPDGEQGFPGELDLTVAYSLTDKGELVIRYEAVSSKDTVYNPTNHAYFNIGDTDDVLGHILDIKASAITPVDDELIPHGEIMEIDGTPFSFKGGVLLGKNMHSSEKMIASQDGFDLNYVLDRDTKNGLELCATVYDPASGRYMECFTTFPGVQLYTSNRMGGMKGKKEYPNWAALCLETQCFPNSPNCPNYPSATLKKGETYRSETVYKFSVK